MSQRISVENLVVSTNRSDRGTRPPWIGLRLARQHPSLTGVLLGAALCQGILQGFVIWALRSVLAGFARLDSLSYLAVGGGAAMISVAWFLRSVSTFVGQTAEVRLAARVEIDLMQRLLAKLLTLSVSFFERASQGDLVVAAYQDIRGFGTLILQITTVILTTSRVIGLAAVAWLISPKLAALSILGLVAGLLPAHWFGRRITSAARRQRDARVALHDSFLQLAPAIRVIKVNRSERRLIEHARALARRLQRQAIQQGQSRNAAHLLLDLASGVGLVVVLFVGVHDVRTGALDWAGLLALLVALIAVHAPVLRLLGVFSQLGAVVPSLDRVSQVLRMCPDSVDLPDARRLDRAPETIVLESLSFAHPGGDVVLDSVSATFHQGETIGIVGPSGAGKSTLLALLLRLYEPTGGRILLDGVDLREIRHADLLERCAIVLQEPVVFDDTIANNIRWASPSATMDEVVAAARAAMIHDEIMQTPDGYETRLGRGTGARGMSVGQKQRICIAAALLKNTPLLFLDEATSNLDSVAERTVQAAIDRLVAGRTTFIVAHRLSTLQHVDRIMVLDRGRMVGLGTHEELMVSCPTYREPWQYQYSTS